MSHKMPQALAGLPECPQELLEAILGNYADDIRTLRQCALVCQSWRRLSQSWLFREVDLSADDHSFLAFDDLFDRLTRVLDESPHLGTAIRSLTVHGDGIMHPDFLFILAKLPGVETLELRRIGYQHRGTGASWKCHSETLRKAVFPMLPGISRLRIVNSTSPGFSELLSLTCHVRGLTGLEIHRMRWKAKSLVANIPLSDTDYNSDVGENGTTKNVRLDSLELHNTLSADDCLSSWISPSLYQSVDLEGIRRFHCTGPDAHSALLVLLRSIGGISTALTELKLTIFDIADKEPISIKMLPALRSLKLESMPQRPQAPHIGHWLAAWFTNVNFVHPFREFSIGLGCGCLSRGHSWDPWIELDKALNIPELGSLLSVDIQVSRCVYERVADHTGRRELTEALKQLSDRGVLYVR